jgi:hypothetical protein
MSACWSGGIGIHARLKIVCRSGLRVQVPPPAPFKPKNTRTHGVVTEVMLGIHARLKT